MKCRIVEKTHGCLGKRLNKCNLCHMQKQPSENKSSVLEEPHHKKPPAFFQ
jgi:hypothetical protein